MRGLNLDGGKTQIAVDRTETCLLDVQQSFSQFTVPDQSLFVSCTNPQVVGEAGLAALSRGYGSKSAALGKEGTKKDGGTRPHVAGRGKGGLSDLHTELELFLVTGGCQRALCPPICRRHKSYTCVRVSN